MPNDLTTRPRVLGPDNAAHDDGVLMHDLTVLNTMIGRYVLCFLDADAGRRKPIPITDELVLAERLATAAEAIAARVARRAQSDSVAEGGHDLDPDSGVSGDRRV